MRDTFIESLICFAREDPNIFLVVGDLGYSVVESFAEEFPERFLNAGIAEQNMAGLAAGLASTGYHVFIYSIANFPLIRCLEQLRNDICYHNRSVTIVSVGGGLSYGSLGYSHHATEDLAVTLAMPNLRVFAPGDPWEVKACMKKIVSDPGPAYLRLGKSGEPRFHTAEPTWESGELVELRPGDKLLLLTTGGVVDLAFSIHDLLIKHNIRAAISSLPEVSALTVKGIEKNAAVYDLIVTLEEHRSGGLSGLLASLMQQLECLNGKKNKSFMFSLNITKNPPTVSGSVDYLRKKMGLDPVLAVSEILKVLARIDEHHEHI